MIDLTTSTAGLAGCAVAVIGFGTQGVFVKGPAIKKAGVDPIVVTLIFSAWVGVVGLAGTLVAGVVEPGAPPFWDEEGWERVWWVALVYAPGQLLLLVSCRRIGATATDGLSCLARRPVPEREGGGGRLGPPPQRRAAATRRGSAAPSAVGQPRAWTQVLVSSLRRMQ